MYIRKRSSLLLVIKSVKYIYHFEGQNISVINLKKLIVSNILQKKKRTNKQTRKDTMKL